MNCLWIAREIPFPLDSGDRIYTARLSQAFGDANGRLSFVGLADEGSGKPPSESSIDWLGVSGKKHGVARSLASTLPLVAAMHAIPAYARQLDELFARSWDAIVFDHYGSGWALRRFLSSRQGRMAKRPRLAYIAHNHEELVLRAVAAESDTSLVRRLGFWQNYLKVRAMERFMVRHVDLVAAITEEDAASFSSQQPGIETLVLTPGYDGKIGQARTLTGDCPRHVVMLGSFRWAAKQENLRQFLRVADPLFAENGIVFDVVGDMPPGLRSELGASVKATRLHGFVDDPSAFLERARIALVPEAIGGGFKLKFLDYIFHRVPVATLADAAAGLPASVRGEMISSDSFAGLAGAVVEHIDAVERLNSMQEKAFEAAGRLFRWRDRGDALVRALSK